MFDNAVLIAMGSSLAGEFATREALLEAALSRFAAAGLKPVKRSCWWRSASWPDPTLPDYINGLAIVETSLSAPLTMAALRRIEQEFGRARSVENAPRTLDLDLIAHGRTIMETADLIVPHPRAAERLFVMGPLAEIAPDWRHPLLAKTAAELATAATVGLDAKPV